MSIQHIRSPQVTFNKAQLSYLESMYPAQVFSAGNTADQMRHYFGQQEVLALVRKFTRGNSSDDIPISG